MNQQLTGVDLILAKKWTFLAVFFIIFSLSYGLLYVIDFLPEPKTNDSEIKNKIEVEAISTTTVNDTTEIDIATNQPETISPEISTNNSGNQTGPSLPAEIIIPSLNREVTVLNPSSRSVADLDTALLSGVVRHPDSAVLGEAGNIFILGHSSYLPTVFNHNFQAFNGIQNLVWGDKITLESNGVKYIYQVKKVFKAKASEVTVPVAGVGKRLTLATCNSFGAKDDRYVVEADFVESQTI